jgi:hypothetical protein
MEVKEVMYGSGSYGRRSGREWRWCSAFFIVNVFVFGQYVFFVSFWWWWWCYWKRSLDEGVNK